MTPRNSKLWPNSVGGSFNVAKNLLRKLIALDARKKLIQICGLFVYSAGAKKADLRFDKAMIGT